MIERRVVGDVPPKHHIAFRDAQGRLRYEQCLTRSGFSGPYTILYHVERPHTQRLAPTEHGWDTGEPVRELGLAKRHYRSQNLERSGGPPIDARRVLLVNDDIALGVAYPEEADPVYSVNADADELVFIFEGSGVVRTLMGDLRFEQNDYVCIPKGVLHRFIPDSQASQYWLTMECTGPLGLPAQWRNPVGQLRMDAPYSHRDFRGPDFRGPLDEGIRHLVVKRRGQFHGFVYEHSPLDVVGWDGSVYPFVFPILNFQPRAGLVHLPPDWHGTFATRGALICSFVPRVVDFHEQAIPCPYPHSSVDCDEFLFYCHGEFTSRKGIGPGSISHHPAGIPHGPHPGAYENSIGSRRTEELAVMIDTTRPLLPTRLALSVEDPDYQDSFV